MGERIVGIDEVGRGCFAGPLVVGAVLLGETWIEGLMDSKMLSPARREVLAPIIMEQAAAYGLGWVQPNEIDKFGLSSAQKLGAERALKSVLADYDSIVVDGSYNFLGSFYLRDGKKYPVAAIVKADASVRAVSAASIIAKVARDAYMIKLAQKYPGYGFENNVGYGAPEHLRALSDPTLGVIQGLHRERFEPVQLAKREQAARLAQAA